MSGDRSIPKKAIHDQARKTAKTWIQQSRNVAMRVEEGVVGYMDYYGDYICFCGVLASCFGLKQLKSLNACIYSVCRSRTQDLTAGENH